MNAYDVGDEVRFTAAFKDVGGSNIDPTTVKFKIKNPSGTVVTYEYGVDTEVVKDSVGSYHCDYVLDASGTWAVRWEASGNVSAASESLIYVKTSNF